MKKIKYLIFLLVISSCNQYLGKVEPDYIPKNEVIEIFSNYKDVDNYLEVELNDIMFPKLSNSSLNINELEIVEEDASNDLKEFGVEADSPDLFSSESENSSPEDLLSSEVEEEDDLEIPVFLRRQKN